MCTILNHFKIRQLFAYRHRSTPFLLFLFRINKKFIMFKNGSWQSPGDMCAAGEKSANGTQSAMCQWDETICPKMGTSPSSWLNRAPSSFLFPALHASCRLPTQHNPILIMTPAQTNLFSFSHPLDFDAITAVAMSRACTQRDTNYSISKKRRKILQKIA